ncbi:hypothetical protein SBA1_320030 [Candidatus Sulfotelmatobacter kueseliae]|uniref:Uncharacterized protein n=1 Tax=Candidatus Sulfotelmatobacter kueseliae TaxID=2042962 RepID=A0A2U3KMB9_9BACT|nr:hypothetical protein SBA1_320030 [Candidatus Sulfotelmatobacter kueseliae]
MNEVNNTQAMNEIPYRMALAGG